jgi:glycine betaine/choline ABC-type transport system substrate-binding protein
MSFISCRRGNRTTIETNDGSSSQKIEYLGRIVFSEDQTRIESIAKGGYVKFTRNGRSVEAKNGHDGKVAYEFNGDSEVNVLDDDQKQFLSYAIKTIIKERAKLRANKNY